MATSGSIDLTATGTDIITEALEQMGILSEGVSPSANQLTSCSRTLNYLIKALQAEGLNIFTLQRSYLFLQKDINSYNLLSSSGGSHWTDSFTSTQLSAAAVATDTTITVDSITGISDGDYIGIQLDSGASHWTTVNGAPSGSTVTLTDAMPSAAAIDSYVYAYTTKADRPMKLYAVMLKDTSGEETPVTVVKSPMEYIELPNKTSDGAINTVWYQPKVADGKLRVWPETNDVTDYLVVWSQRTLDDIDTVATDLVDFPQEWFLPLAFNLAANLIGKYNPPSSIKNVIIAQANYWKETAEGWDAEDGFEIQPESENNR